VCIGIPALLFSKLINTDKNIQCQRSLRGGSSAIRLLGLRVRIPPGHRYLSVVSVGFRQVEVSEWCWSLAQSSRAECGVSECDREASIMRRHLITRGSKVMEICIHNVTFSFRLAINLKCRHIVLICVTLTTTVTINPVRHKANRAIYITPIYSLSTPQPFCAS
jgi:hypothetical protein